MPDEPMTASEVLARRAAPLLRTPEQQRAADELLCRALQPLIDRQLAILKRHGIELPPLGDEDTPPNA